MLRATFDRKPILALMEDSAKAGHLRRDDVHARLVHAEENHMYDKWGLANEMVDWKYQPQPTASQLFEAIFAQPPIDWHRVGVFQQVTLRLMALRLLPKEHPPVYVKTEIIHTRPLIEAIESMSIHAYCSELNVGCVEVLAEMGKKLGFGVDLVDSTDVGDVSKRLSVATPVLDTKWTSPPKAKLSTKANFTDGRTIRLTTSPEHMQTCKHMLLYLDARTWRSGGKSEQLAAEIRQAMSLGVHVVLVHENAKGGAYHGCEFGTFFAHVDGATPEDLLRGGIYNEIAIPMMGGEWRDVSYVLLAQALSGRAPEDVNGRQSSMRRAATRAKRVFRRRRHDIKIVETNATIPPGEAPPADLGNVSHLSSVSLSFSQSESGALVMPNQPPPPSSPP